MRPDPGRDIQEAFISRMSLERRAAIMERLRATGLAIVWQQSDAAGPMTELERAMFILDRLYPEMPPQHRAQIDAKLRAEWEAGRWLGLQRPPPLRPDTPDPSRPGRRSVLAGSADGWVGMLPAREGGPSRMPHRPMATPFVGRDRELQELLRGLDEIGSGLGRLFLVGGEPGIGKSRLADELAIQARGRGYSVLWGRGWEDAGAPAYWPWVQALRTYLRSTEPALIREHLGAGALEIAHMLPDLGALFPDLGSPETSDSDAARFQLFDSATSFLVNVARANGLVVILDDLHAADAESILFLRFLGSQLQDTRMLVVGTYRDLELGPDHPLKSAIEHLAREPTTRQLRLGGLPESAVVEVIRSTSGIDPSAQLIAALSRETGGNPLFLGEAVRLLAAEGRLDQVVAGDDVRISVPASVRGVIARRLEKLEDGTAQALTSAAALGPEFALETLRRIQDRHTDEIAESLEPAIRADLLVRVTGVPGRYRFSHDLIRETLYEELSTAQRIRLHARIGVVLEQVYATGLDAHSAELAYHYFEATQGANGDSPPEERDRAVELAGRYARRAGEEATSSLAFEEAARFYRMALRVVGLDAARDEVMIVELLLDLGDVQARAGDLEGSRATFLEAAAIARRLSLANQLARAAVGYGGRMAWPRAGNDRHLVPLLQDALALSGGLDDRLRVRLLSRLACAWRDSLDEHRADSAALSREAVELARASGDFATLGYALVGRFGAIWWPDDPEERLIVVEELLSVATADGDGERLIDAHIMGSMTYMELARMDEARAEVERVTTIARDLRQPAQYTLARSMRAALALFDGDYGLATELIDRERDPVNTSTPIQDHVSVTRMHRFLLRREIGGLAAEEATVRAAIEQFPWYPLHRAALCCLLFDLGRLDESRLVFSMLSRDRFRALPRDNEWLLGVCLASEACARLGDGRAADVLYEQLAPFAGRHAIGFVEGSVGAVDRYLGLLAATAGRLPEAEAHFLDGIALNEAMGGRPWAAHTKADLAEMLVERDAPGDRRRAADLVRDARSTAGQLGMISLEARLRQGTDPPEVLGQPTPGVPTSGALRREGEYWTVTFDGKSYRLQDAKGLRYLARLLASPGREIHVLDLVGAERGVAADLPPRGTRLPDEAVPGGFGDGGELLDAAARHAYRERLQELDAELAEAEEWNDPGRVERSKEERDVLIQELASAVGLGGRAREFSSAPERARISVGKAIRSALHRIEANDPALGRHLAATVHTGSFCSYSPDPTVKFSWEL